MPLPASSVLVLGHHISLCSHVVGFAGYWWVAPVGEWLGQLALGPGAAQLAALDAHGALSLQVGLPCWGCATPHQASLRSQCGVWLSAAIHGLLAAGCATWYCAAALFGVSLAEAGPQACQTGVVRVCVGWWRPVFGKHITWALGLQLCCRHSVRCDSHVLYWGEG